MAEEGPDARPEAQALRRLVTASRPAEGDANEVSRARLDFYVRREFRPAWVDADLRARLVEALAGAGAHGLDPLDYEVPELRRRLARFADAEGEERLATEVALTDAFLRHASHLVSGRVRPADLDIEWHLDPRRKDLAAALERAAGTGDFEAVLATLVPPHEEYGRLRRALARYRQIDRDGGWPAVPEGPALEPGDPADPQRLLRLRERLSAESGEAALASAATGERRYGEDLAARVADFQRRHGIEPDGVLGAETVRELNVPASARIRRLVLNLERWRWVPDELGARHLRVNVPSFRLELHERERVALGMKVVVGKEGWGTPFFHDRMTHVIVNPEWNVPASIAAEDVLPKVREDPAWLQRERFVVLDARGEPPREIDPASIDWKRVEAGDRSLRFRQKPGPGNSLGRLKFVLPNRFGIYLHDTPAKRLFEEVDRAFSHGCIRVEKPLALAAALLPDWDRSRLREAVEAGRSRRIDLPEPLPVYILYWTASVGEAGEIRFDQDLYGVDENLDRALRAREGRGYSASSISSPISSAPSFVSSHASPAPSFVASQASPLSSFVSSQASSAPSSVAS